jgi:hypothetical protein
MFEKTLLFSMLLCFLFTFYSCEDEPCEFDISGTYSLQSTSCEEIDFPQSITILSTDTEFTFEGSVYTIAECEVIADFIESERMVIFDDNGFDFEGEFEDDTLTVNCEGRYTRD